MFERFATDARTIVRAAGKEARANGEASVQAVHLLLALSLRPEIRNLGLDHDDVVAALSTEEEQSLARLGIELAGYDVPVRARRADGAKLGASAKLAIQRALSVTTQRGQRQITAANLLLGVLAAEHGRVPRALRLAGVDVSDLRARL